MIVTPIMCVSPIDAPPRTTFLWANVFLPSFLLPARCHLPPPSLSRPSKVEWGCCSWPLEQATDRITSFRCMQQPVLTSPLLPHESYLLNNNNNTTTIVFKLVCYYLQQLLLSLCYSSSDPFGIFSCVCRLLLCCALMTRLLRVSYLPTCSAAVFHLCTGWRALYLRVVASRLLAVVFWCSLDNSTSDRTAVGPCFRVSVSGSAYSRRWTC